MAEWVWEGRTRAGELRKSVIEAETERDVQAAPSTAEYYAGESETETEGHFPVWVWWSSVSQYQLVVFVRQFATMIDAGLTPGAMFGDSL